MQPPRLTAIPFPLSPHRPGVSPPHAHDHHDPLPPLSPDSDLTPEPAFLFAIDLFNAGYWWEAHESWESLWLRLPKDSSPALLLQALIQAAAAHLQIALGRAEAIPRMIDRMDARVRQAMTIPIHNSPPGGASPAHPPAHPLGLDFHPWWAHTLDYLRLRAAAQPVAHDPARFPFLRLAQSP